MHPRRLTRGYLILMAESFDKARRFLSEIISSKSKNWKDALTAEQASEYCPLPTLLVQNTASVARLNQHLTEQGMDLSELLDKYTEAQLNAYLANIENMVGTVKIPLGLAGPIRINGIHAKGDYILPLATHEAALVASHHRGAIAVSESGGCKAAVINEGVSRVPALTFPSMVEVSEFLVWLLPREDKLIEVAEQTTRHGKVSDLKFTIEGNTVYLHFEYKTGDAAGQNMVTVATEEACRYIRENSPVQPINLYVESNLSGDKKASMTSFHGVRGKKVTCEVLLPKTVLDKRLGVTARQMEDYWRISSVGGVLSGSIGIQGHYANGLAALFIACGQDAACVAEAAVGVTRFEMREKESLYVSVTMPNLIVGTVGGGTDLPSQSTCLDILGLRGEGKAKAFAEVCAGMALAGELSIIAALASGNFARSHAVLARRRKKT